MDYDSLNILIYVADLNNARIQEADRSDSRWRVCIIQTTRCGCRPRVRLYVCYGYRSGGDYIIVIYNMAGHYIRHVTSIWPGGR